MVLRLLPRTHEAPDSLSPCIVNAYSYNAGRQATGKTDTWHATRPRCSYTHRTTSDSDRSNYPTWYSLRTKTIVEPLPTESSEAEVS